MQQAAARLSISSDAVRERYACLAERFPLRIQAKKVKKALPSGGGARVAQ